VKGIAAGATGLPIRIALIPEDCPRSPAEMRGKPWEQTGVLEGAMGMLPFHPRCRCACAVVFWPQKG